MWHEKLHYCLKVRLESLGKWLCSVSWPTFVQLMCSKAQGDEHIFKIMPYYLQYFHHILPAEAHLALFLHKYGWCCGGLWKCPCDVQGCFALLSEQFSCIGFDHLIHPLHLTVFVHMSFAPKKNKNKQKPGHMKIQGLYIQCAVCPPCVSKAFSSFLLS